MADSTTPSKGFDRLSRVYDLLVALVYGRALRRAQTGMLPRVKAGSRVLILGGGTGWFIQALLEAQPEVEVTYVELSQGMMSKSKERISKAFSDDHPRIHWVLGTVHDLPETAAFDLVCTHCYLDLFADEKLKQEVEAIALRMNPKSAWHFSDFRYAPRGPMRWISRALIWSMYRFFQWFCGIQAGRLGEFRKLIQEGGWKPELRQREFGGMVEAVWFQRLKRGMKLENVMKQEN